MVATVMNEFDQRVDQFFKNYQDRGMKKWSGFFLSDHTRLLEQGEKIVEEADLMAEEAISLNLLKAYSNHYVVKVFINSVDEEGQREKPIRGLVNGFVKDAIVIGERQVQLADIKAVEVLY